MGLTKTDGAPLAYAWLGGMGTRESQFWFTSLSIPNWIPQEGMRNSLNELLITYLLLLLRRFSRVRLCATPETAGHHFPANAEKETGLVMAQLSFLNSY